MIPLEDLLSKMVEPSKSLVYFYFSCPDCDTQYSTEFRLSELKRSQSLECSNCGREYKTRPIFDIQVVYENGQVKEEKKKDSVNYSPEFLERVKGSLVSCGWTATQSKHLINRIASTTSNLTLVDFMQRAILEGSHDGEA